MRVRWGFLGAGFVAGKALAPAVHSADGAVLQAVAARDVTRARRLDPDGRVHSSYQDLLDDPDVDAVYVSLPNDAHREWTIRALEAGKHVLCEKPLAMDAGEVAAMGAAAAAADRLLVEAAWFRWHPRTRRAAALVRSGAVGLPSGIEAAFAFDGVPEGNYRLDPQRGGGALYDVGTYAVAGALAMVPRAPVVVDRATARTGPTGVDLGTEAVLGLAGTTAVIHAAIDEPENQRLIVQGDEGRIEVGESDCFTSWNNPSELTISDRGGVRTEHFAPCDPYRLMVEAVSQALVGADAWVVPFGDSVRVATTLDAIRESATP